MDPLQQLDPNFIAAVHQARETKDGLTIYTDGRHPDPSRLLLNGILNGNLRGPWQDAALTPALQAEERRRERLERDAIVPCPEPVFEEEP